jgi:hypothetical protein
VSQPHRWLFYVAALFLAGPCLHAQGGHGDRVISGVVVSSASGNPLDAADVTLTDSKTSALVAETSSDAEGRFAFQHLPDGRYALRVTHRGYIASAFDAHEGFSSAIVTGEGLVTTGLRFAIKPLAVIYGTITDDSGDPVQEARVSLYRPDERTGTGRILRSGAVISDDQGNYEFSRLSPGNYYIAVTAQPWYAAHRQLTIEPPGDPAQQKAPSPLDVAYPITYYADVTDSDAATPIPVKPGDRIPVNFTLHAVPAVHIIVQLPVSGHRDAYESPQLRQEAFGSMQTMGPQSATYSFHDGGGDTRVQTVELSGVAPGHYEMDLRVPGSDSTRSFALDATPGRQLVDASAGETLADISGKVAMAGGGNLPLDLSVTLVTPQGEEDHATRVEGDGTFAIHGVRPGLYEVLPRAPETAVAAVQITASGGVIENHFLRLGSSPVNLAATLVEGSATVRGFAKKNGKPQAGAMVVLVPSGSNPGKELFRRDQSDTDGGFTLKRVIPGEYTVVAIEDGWALDWARPEVIARYLPGGVKVNVLPHSKDTELPNAVEVQAK